MNFRLINHQYEGTLLDFIECKECGFNRSRRDIFTEVPLVIRDMHSIEEAVASYITPEVLTGSERWSCDQCNKKVDASKGLRFSKFVL
jgi:ubiquitin C-terminal hydrolase